MKLAIVAVTRQGSELAVKIKETWHDETVDLYLPANKGLSCVGNLYDEPLREVMSRLWPLYDGIVCIMSLGIVVRLIAPHLEDKRQDPAIVVMDEKGQFAISALSGHIGGANELALKLGRKLGAEPVITTATDINNLPAIEMVAKNEGLLIENFNLVKKVNSALVNGEQINIYTDIPLKVDWPEQVQIKESGEYNNEDTAVKVLVTNKEISIDSLTLLLRPQNLVVGVGCRRGISKDKILNIIKEAFRMAGLSLNSLKKMASIDIKADEIGLLEAAKELKIPISFYSKEEINDLYDSRGKNLSFSQYVYEQLGVGGVCEAVTLLSSREAKLVFPKMKMEGATVAIAVEN